MLNDQEIHSLIQCPKLIVARSPRSGYREYDGHNRCDLDLIAEADQVTQFSVFIRQNTKFIENFSIGLRYRTGNRDVGTITLVRYNGPHGEYSRAADMHFAKPHIHYLTGEELAEGHLQPRERNRELTDLYFTLDEAIYVFLQDISATNGSRYFPALPQLRMFNGY